MKQHKHHRQPTLEQRYQISRLRKAGMSLRAIADEVGISCSTVIRELSKNSTADGYNADAAQISTNKRRSESHKHNKRSPETDRIISESLSLGLSPEAISQRTKVELSPESVLCHGTIYTSIYNNKARGGRLFSRLPRHVKKRWKGGKRRHMAGASLIPQQQDISKRHTILDKRSRIGDWEDDTGLGKKGLPGDTP
ncbi:MULTISPECIES: IS30 family transposase [Desulfosediminicola]|uniref:IS30 family transposase n=1 Tax=Desulfosediminicola TaxID=2886823 RepID=UPI00142F0C6E|nr:IS30 family transposase [Desulfosediminicola ganghwensis]